jgi:hypothetical protein
MYTNLLMNFTPGENRKNKIKVARWIQHRLLRQQQATKRKIAQSYDVLLQITRYMKTKQSGNRENSEEKDC